MIIRNSLLFVFAIIAASGFLVMIDTENTDEVRIFGFGLQLVGLIGTCFTVCLDDEISSLEPERDSIMKHLYWFFLMLVATLLLVFYEDNGLAKIAAVILLPTGALGFLINYLFDVSERVLAE